MKRLGLMAGKTDREMMARALELAARALGRTSPNPLVGAVVVKAGRIVGEGYHQRAGGAHAELIALKKASGSARGATLYVNLEPCAHYGRTPPCVKAIIEAGVGKVVAAMRDPNPLVRGRGFNALRRAGIEVEVGLGRAEAARLNEIFIHHARTGRPFVALKLAQSLDGKIAAGAGVRTAISSPPALRLAHRLRACHDAILIGVATAIADDPRLDVRLIKRARQPLRVVLDSSLCTPPAGRLVTSAARQPLLLFYDPACSSAGRSETLAAKGVLLEPLACGRDGLLPLVPVLERLAARGVASLLVEGGARVATSFLRQKLVNRLHLFIAPRLLGERGPLPGIGDLSSSQKGIELRELQCRFVGPDLYLTGLPE